MLLSILIIAIIFIAFVWWHNREVDRMITYYHNHLWMMGNDREWHHSHRCWCR